MFGPLRWGWAVITASTGTVLIGLGAFWLSFMALADLARRSGIASGQAWVWPLLVDGLIVVATIAVVALDGHARTWYPWALLIAGALISVIANATHALVAADSTVPGVLAAAVASVPPLVLVASTHLTVVLIRSANHHFDTPPETSEAEPPVGERSISATSVTDSTVAASTDDSSAHELTLVPPPHRPTADITGLPIAERADATEPDPPETEPADDTAPATDSEAADRRSARRVEAARLREQGWSNRKIAAHLHVHPSTVGRWLPRTAPDNTTTTTHTSEENPS